MTERIAVYGDFLTDEVKAALELDKAEIVVITDPTIVDEPTEGFTGAVVSIRSNSRGAWALCNSLRHRDVPIEPILVVLDPDQLGELVPNHEFFDDFMISPIVGPELRSRWEHLAWSAGNGVRPEILEYGPISLNVETYQASVGTRSLDLTYMEYELLRFFVSNPGKVFGRDALLNQVWGYDYYGGARTVDVHVRRLRSKLGDSHSGLIITIRSVGYKLGQAGRTPDS